MRIDHRSFERAKDYHQSAILSSFSLIFIYFCDLDSKSAVNFLRVL